MTRTPTSARQKLIVVGLLLVAAGSTALALLDWPRARRFVSDRTSGASAEPEDWVEADSADDRKSPRARSSAARKSATAGAGAAEDTAAGRPYDDDVRGPPRNEPVPVSDHPAVESKTVFTGTPAADPKEKPAEVGSSVPAERAPVAPANDDVRAAPGDDVMQPRRRAPAAEAPAAPPSRSTGIEFSHWPQEPDKR